MKQPKRLFRRRGDILHVGRAPLPAIEAWVAAHRSRIRPGTVVQVEVQHDEGCPYPQGGACRCADGPEIKIIGEDPGAN